MSTQFISIERGVPPYEFISKAWASEPLTNVLKDINIPLALPPPDEEISLVAKDEERIIGQCSTSLAVKYWSHLDKVECNDQNLSTRLFIAIHKKAVKDEREYLDQLGETSDKAFHNAGVAVLPEYRGRHLGRLMLEHQIKLYKENKIKTLFCETSNYYAAVIVKNLGFTKIAEYSYESLSKELDYPDLATLKDYFTVWCFLMNR